MRTSSVADTKHLRELIRFGKDTLGLTEIIAERRTNSARVTGKFVHEGKCYPVHVEASLNSTDIRAHTNAKSALVAAVNAIKAELRIPIIKGISQVRKGDSKPKAPVRHQPKAKLHLDFGPAQERAREDTTPTRLDSNPFEALRPLFSKLHPTPATHTLWIQNNPTEPWERESSSILDSSLERRAMRLLREGKAVRIVYANRDAESS